MSYIWQHRYFTPRSASFIPMLWNLSVNIIAAIWEHATVKTLQLADWVTWFDLQDLHICKAKQLLSTNPPSVSSCTSQKLLIRCCAVLLTMLSAVVVVPWPGLNWASLLVNYAVQQAAGWALIQIRAALPTGHCLPTIELTMNIHTEESHYKQSLREGDQARGGFVEEMH